MDAAGAVSAARDLGEIPTLIVILILVLAFLGWAIKQMVVISRELKDQRDSQTEKDKEQDSQIQHLKETCLKRDEFYQELGGWRTELQNTEQRLTKTIEMLFKSTSGGQK